MVAVVTRVNAVPKTIADAACESLDKEIAQMRKEGALQAGQRSMVNLEWTPETAAVCHVYEMSADLTPIQSLRRNPRSQVKFKWVGPIVYVDVMPNPMSFPSLALGYGIIGIIALGDLHLPEIGDSGPIMIESGSVAYFRDLSPVVYRACGGGRGILFYLSESQVSQPTVFRQFWSYSHCPRIRHRTSPS